MQNLHEILVLLLSQQHYAKQAIGGSSPDVHQQTADKRNVVYTCSGKLFSLQKEESADTCYNMDEPWGHDAGWNGQSQKDNDCQATGTRNLLRVARLVETESRTVAAKAWSGVGNGSGCFLGTECLLGKGKRALEMDGGDGGVLMWTA